MEDRPQKKSLQTLYPLDSFGIQKVSLSEIRVERLEERIRPGVPFPHKHDFFQLLLVTKGSGNHRIDFRMHPVRPGQLFVMKPGQMHTWKLARGTKGIIIEFNHQSLNAIKESHLLIQDLSFFPDVYEIEDSENYREFLNLAQMMLREFAGKKELNDLALQGMLTVFLVAVGRSGQRQLGQRKSVTTLEKFRDLLEKNYRKHHSVEFYAKALHTTPKALTMQISRSIGKPPRQLIQERLLLEAKRYLAFSQLTVAQIGFDLGFDDANYFTRFFRVHEKQTPLQFRRQTAA